MAISVSSSMVSGISIPVPCLQKSKDLGVSPVTCNHVIPLRTSNLFASRPRLSRRVVLVKATTLQEDEERVVVENSFDPKSFPEKEQEGTSGGSSDIGSPPSSGMEKWIIKLEQSVNVLLTDSVIKILDTLYNDRDYARFYVLETIARVPYFAFISVLHMYESFGWWRRADYLKVHFAESWTEMHHLLIMEELGGNSWWFDRLLAQHIAAFYYFMTVFMCELLKEKHRTMAQRLKLRLCKVISTTLQSCTSTDTSDPPLKVVNEPDVQCPVAEMSTRSKLSCLSWNKYTKNYIASSDYEGIVTVWDVTTRQSVMEYEEHEKRAWSVDFSPTEPSMLISGSDDCKVKVWCTNQEASVLNIDMKANICSVKYNPGSSLNVAVGSADHHIHYYDLRKPNQPLYIFSGHKKAVSYVKFLSSHELASASTDSALRIWDVKENVPLGTFRGHTNEKNFVGLTVNSEYIACGSETDENLGSYFISAVCWKSDSPTMVAANSQGTIKVLVLAP